VQTKATAQTTDQTAAQTQKLLHTLWNRNLPMMRERVQLLERAAETARSADLTPPLRRDAATTAHKLAGSLGMFGYAQGTEIARQLEVLLDNPAPPNPDTLSTLAADLRRTLQL
jgi:HPt (histidine-containing phosphotransfer) domain-containing protein